MHYHFYRLEGHKAIPESDVLKWGRWFEKANRRVANTEGRVKLNGKPIGLVRVSTVFLGLDHQLSNGPPLLFETMVFGGPMDNEMIRTPTWEAAEVAHEQMIERVKLETQKAGES